ncbi:Protein of unknown function DUF3405 [Penicillium griseofulvum]|uniref:Uncharacterized protein n=1 Tax=Penicillium patulum TaxID=5078 RepID=A0A135LG96_PENPA|nr:Protein of unknown function DUF3405 [Penicillium griseofulvum]KXG47974.1 Protein of unknown function DUF3405 [Penicillium griseofulvum]
MMSVYPGIQKDFPSPMLGSYSATGIDGYVCADRFSRLGAYGSASGVNWNETNWGSLQAQCFERNAGRYPQTQTDSRPVDSTLPHHPPLSTRAFRNQAPPSSLQHKTRSAIILRARSDMEWTENLKQNVRLLIMELSLHSGAEYEVFILLHVKDERIPIYTKDPQVMNNIKAQLVPAEFHDMVVFFNDHTLASWYRKVEEHSPGLQDWQPLQAFSRVFQDFDYYWQVDMSSRFTGHTYHFLEKSAEFAKRQPRKYLWERNAYFYIPGTHGTWKNFLRRIQSSMKGRMSVWGPKSIPQVNPVGPSPPVASPDDDDYEWGVGEEADLITFLPIFDPTNTDWLFGDHFWGIPKGLNPPRAASVVAMARVSKNLFHQMHDLQAQQGIGIFTEMTAPTLALWHGLKAVYVPHPLYVDGKWTPKELGRIMNPGEPDKINGGENSFWNWDHRWDHILYRMTYMFTTQTAEDFYRRWLGYPMDPKQYTDGLRHQDEQGRSWFDSGDLREDLYGPLCFPSMLLHTIKNTNEKKGPNMPVPL